MCKPNSAVCKLFFSICKPSNLCDSKEFCKFLNVNTLFDAFFTCPSFLVRSAEVTFSSVNQKNSVYTGLQWFTRACPPMEPCPTPARRESRKSQTRAAGDPPPPWHGDGPGPRGLRKCGVQDDAVSSSRRSRRGIGGSEPGPRAREAKLRGTGRVPGRSPAAALRARGAERRRAGPRVGPRRPEQARGTSPARSQCSRPETHWVVQGC
jgi:hypothetical protein